MFKSRLRHSVSQQVPWGKYLLILFVIALLAGTVYLMVRMNVFGSAPQVSLRWKWNGQPLQPGSELAMGQKMNMNLVVENPEGSLCQGGIQIKQGALKKEVLQFSKNDVVGQDRDTGYSMSFDLTKRVGDLSPLGFQEGRAEVAVWAKDCALLGGKTTLNFPAVFDYSPPRVQLTSNQHYVNQGGADLATYTASPDTVWSGIRVGPYSFRGYPKPGGLPGEHFAFFVFSYELPANTPIEGIAIDAAGNESKSSLAPARFFPKEFRQRELPIDDAFIQTKVADIISNTPGLQNTGDNLKNFLLVNRGLRKKNAAFLADVKSDEKFYWKDAFKPLSNAAVEANFADYRSYMYNGEKVDEQVHLGFDLAIVERAPVYAGNAGKIAFADYLGIYGNTVIIDHGYGLITLYGHLSSMDVAVGDTVAREQKIGNSGVSGLAGGDHLHFSMLIQGVQTNPVEFWDQHWIKDHVYLRVDPQFFGQQ